MFARQRVLATQLINRFFGRVPPPEERFTAGFHARGFGGDESVSGPGSDLVQTEVIRREIPALLKELGTRTLLDAPCGDFNWMRQVDLPVEQYIGADVVAELVAENQRRYGDAKRQFRQLDLTRDPLPRVDVIHCRDCFVHLTTREVLRAIENIRRSGSTYLLTTTFPTLSANKGLGVGWRALNLRLRPFKLPEPLKLINEGCTEEGGRHADKSLGLWRIAEL